MPTSYTSLLGLALPVTGELSGTWGDTVNNFITQYLDSAVDGTQTISGSQTSVTLSVTTNAALSQVGAGATGSAQYAIVNCTGNPASTLTITAPASSRQYLVLNSTSTSQSVIFRGAGPTTGVTLVSGERCIVAWNGSDFVKIATSVADGVTSVSGTGTVQGLTLSGTVTSTGSLTLGGSLSAVSLTSQVSGTLPVANGGTGQTSYTDGQLLIGNTATTSLSKATLTAGSGVSITNGNGSITISATGTGGTVTSVGQTFTGGLISVSGSPVTTSGTLALTVAGTSGGIPYFSSASTWASSGALAANALVVGGGAGLSPATITTGTGVVTALGVNTGSAGAFVVNGGALGTPSSGTVTNLTGTASININGTVGATTPTTGSFTTLTTSSTVTINGGTANGVAYLNGSKVLTTGSALTFNGTSLGVGTGSPDAGAAGYTSRASFDGTNPAINLRNASGSNSNWQIGTAGSAGGWLAFYDVVNSTEAMRLTTTGLGIGTSSPGYRLQVDGASTAGFVTPIVAKNPSTNAASAVKIGFDGGGTIWGEIGASYNTNDPYMAFFVRAGAEKVRITDAGNVGVGTISPSYRLDVSTASTPVARFTGASNAYVDFTDGTVTTRLQNSGALLFGTTSNHSLLLRTNSTTQATLDTAGNLGLGVTPSAWSSAWKVMQLGGGTTLSAWATDSGTNLSANAYNDGSWKRINAAAVAQYSLTTLGEHRWNIAGSSTAGSTISFTQAMTLDASGNLGVGLTTQNERLRIGSSSASQARMAIEYNGSALTYLGSYSGIVGSGNATDTLLASTGVLAFGAGGTTERARITSGGNLSVGGTADRGTTVGTAAIQLFNGTAPVGTLTNGVSLYSSSGDLNFMNSSGNGFKVGYRNLPPVGTQTGSYTLAVADVGKYVQVSTGGSITIPTSTFAEGDAITLFNNTTGNITITCSAPTAYIAGTNTVKTSMTLATRGVATVLFISSTLCVVTGNVT